LHRGYPKFSPGFNDVEKDGREGDLWLKTLAFCSFQIVQVTSMVIVAIAFRFAMASFNIFAHHTARVRSSTH
jgi:hypothetical protein